MPISITLDKTCKIPRLPSGFILVQEGSQFRSAVVMDGVTYYSEDFPLVYQCKKAALSGRLWRGPDLALIGNEEINK